MTVDENYTIPAATWPRNRSRLSSVLAQASATSIPLIAKCLRKKSTCTALSWNCCGVSTAENTGTSVRNCTSISALITVSDKFMAVDAAIDHEPGGDDRRIAPGLGEQLRVQRDFERARHLEQIDLRRRDVARIDLLEEG